MMGRFLMYASIAALAVFVFSAYVLLEHGGESIGSEATRVHSVHDLTEQYAVYEGSTVTSEGLLSYSSEHERYQIVDEGNFALVIRSYDGEDDLEALSGSRVRVSGELHHDPEFGLYIDAESVVPVVTPTPVS